MPITPNFSLWSPDDSDDWDLTIDLAAMQVSVDSALNSVPKSASIFGTDAQRLALPRKKGQLFYATDTNIRWRDDGVTWWYHDTGWIALPLRAGWTAPYGGAVYRVTGGLISVEGRLEGTAGAGTAFADVPAPARVTRETVSTTFTVSLTPQVIITQTSGSYLNFSKGGTAISDLRIGGIPPLPVGT